jgi:hypothetical protein
MIGVRIFDDRSHRVTRFVTLRLGVLTLRRYTSYHHHRLRHPGSSRVSFGVLWIIRSISQWSREWPGKQPRKGWTSGGHSSSLGQSGVRRGPIPTTNDPYYLYQISLHFRSTLTSSLKWLGRKAEHHHHCRGVLSAFTRYYQYVYQISLRFRSTLTSSL